MKVFWGLIIFAFFNDCHSFGVYTSRSARPDVVNIGSILTFDSVIGKVAKVAIEAAVDDVNSNPNLLTETKLNITMCDTNFSGYSGIIEGKILKYYFFITSISAITQASCHIF